MKDNYMKDIDLVEDLKNKVLNILNTFRYYYIDSEIYPSVLFLLSLQKDGILDNLILSKSENLYEEIVNQINNSKENSTETYKSLLDVYEPFLLNSKNEILYDAILSLRNLNQLILKEHFTVIFEDLFYQLSKSKGKLGGESLMPMELCRFMSGLAKLPVKAKIYNPFAGFASFGVFLDKGHIYLGQELNNTTWALGFLRLLANQKSNNFKFIVGDSISNWNPIKKYRSNNPVDILKFPSTNEKFDLIICNPPFGLKLNPIYKNLYPTISTVEQFVIENSISSLKDSGKLITVVPNGFLFRGGTEKKTREFLINADLIESIIAIPGGLYSNTLIPVVVLVINKCKTKKGFINLIDASDCIEYSTKKEKKLNDYRLNSIVNSTIKTDSFKSVSVETIIENDYNLNVARYLVNDYQGIKLGDLVSEIQGRKINESENQKAKLIKNKDLKLNPIDFSLDLNSIKDVELSKNIVAIEESCLLLATRDKHINPTFFDYNNIPVFLFKGIYAFKVDNSKIDLEYLISELNSDYVFEQFKSLYTGSILPIIELNDLLNIKINVPTLKEQIAKVEGIKQAFIENKKKELAFQEELFGLKDESFREFASIKHTFRQYLNALQSNVAGTKKFITNNEGNSISLDMMYSKNLNKTFGEHLSSLEGTIQSMTKMLSSFEDTKETSPATKLNLLTLITEAQNRFKNTEVFKFEKVNVDTDSFTMFDNTILEPMISFNEDDFYRLYSNIVSNAMDHGFKDSTKKYSIRTAISFDDKEKNIVLEVSNNGAPMPDNFTLKHLSTRGEKTTNSKGTGMGGADIKAVLNKYNGTLDISNQEEEFFSVTYIIKLPYQYEFTL